MLGWSLHGLPSLLNMDTERMILLAQEFSEGDHPLIRISFTAMDNFCPLVSLAHVGICWAAKQDITTLRLQPLIQKERALQLPCWGLVRATSVPFLLAAWEVLPGKVPLGLGSCTAITQHLGATSFTVAKSSVCLLDVWVWIRFKFFSVTLPNFDQKDPRGGLTYSLQDRSMPLVPWEVKQSLIKFTAGDELWGKGDWGVNTSLTSVLSRILRLPGPVSVWLPA